MSAEAEDTSCKTLEVRDMTAAAHSVIWGQTLVLMLFNQCLLWDRGDSDFQLSPPKEWVYIYIYICAFLQRNDFETTALYPRTLT